jgi:predicted outer membrane lipoprotein
MGVQLDTKQWYEHVPMGVQLDTKQWYEHVPMGVQLDTKQWYEHVPMGVQLDTKHWYEHVPMGVQLDTKQWYEHVPKAVETTQQGKVTILWNKQVRTDRTIANNKTDIVIIDNDKRTCILTGGAISADSNVIIKEPEQNV